MSLPNLSDTLRVLSDQTSQHQVNTSNHATQSADSSDGESGSNCSVRTSFYDQEGTDSIKSITSFTPEEFTAVWLLTVRHVVRRWSTGQEKKSRASGRDVLFMLPTVLRHGQQWNFTAGLFGVNGSTLKMLIVGLVNAVLEHTYKVRVQCTEEKWKMFNCIRDEKTFCSLDYAQYNTNVTFTKAADQAAVQRKEKSILQGNKAAWIQSRNIRNIIETRYWLHGALLCIIC